MNKIDRLAALRGRPAARPRATALATTMAATLAALLAGCAAPQRLAPGLAEAEVLARLGSASGRHALDGGGTRLEFATGPYGRDTWMVDLDAQGRVRGWHNALEEPRLQALQQRVAEAATAGAPMGRTELLRTLGRPGEVVSGGWLAGGALWSWRYPTNDCLLFQATLNADGSVRDAGFNIDLRCDAKADARP